MLAAVFVYYIEVQTLEGLVVPPQGDFILLRSLFSK